MKTRSQRTSHGGRRSGVLHAHLRRMIRFRAIAWTAQSLKVLCDRKPSTCPWRDMIGLQLSGAAAYAASVPVTGEDRLAQIVRHWATNLFQRVPYPLAE